MISTFFQNPLEFFIYVLALIAAIAGHEFSHALVADRLGDPTPRIRGRVTLNPLAHLDLYGSIFLLLFGFGWGKPVPFDPYNLKHPQKDSALISLAGPLSNFIMALICSILLRLFILFKLTFLITIGAIVLVPFLNINVLLGLFNLLPIHPLDGFKIVGGLLPREKAHEWYQLERYGFIFLIILILPFGKYSMLSYIMNPAITVFLNLLVPAGFSGGVFL